MFRVYNVSDCQSCNPFDCSVTNVVVKLHCIKLFDCTEITTTTATTTTTMKPFKPKSTSTISIIMGFCLIVIIALVAFVFKKLAVKQSVTVSQKR